MSSFRTVLGACPLDCPDTCAWQVTVDDAGRAVALRGNADHPYTQGGLCPKVYPWLDYAADPSRLLHPLRRVGPKGSGRFEQVSWESAMDEIAARFGEVIERWGPEAIWPFYGNGNLGWIQGSNGPARVWDRMGASGHLLSICSVAGRAGINLSVGHGAWLDPEDFARAGVVVIWASNTLVTNRHLWPFIEEARRQGAPVVVIDPLRTRTAERADIHLMPRPGSDGALALGLCRAIVEADGADNQFLAERTTGWDEFRAAIAPWTIERTATETDVPPGEIEAVAHILCEQGPMALRIGHGIQRQTNGGQAMRVVSCLAAVTGAFDRPGGGVLYSSSKTPKGYNLDAHRPASLGSRGRTLVSTHLGHNLLELDDPPVAALFMWAANPMVSNPDTNRVRAGLARDDLFTVVVDVHHTETTDYADIVLPSTMQHEQYELNDAYNHCYLHWNEPAVAPPGECLPHTEMWRRLARAMGYEDHQLYASDTELMADLLSSPEFAEAGISVESLRREGFLRLPRQAPPAERGFLTPTGRFEFASEPAAEAGMGRLPEYRPAVEATHPVAGALALLAPASDRHVNSTFAGTRRVLADAEEPVLWIHPDDAAERGLIDGDRVRVHNDRGEFHGRIEVSKRSRVGVLGTTKGWWRQGLNNTIIERDTDIGFGPVFHDNAVFLTKVDS